MTEAAKKAKREYAAKYRSENREKLAAYQREWRKKNPEKAKENQRRYWERKAASMQN